MSARAVIDQARHAITRLDDPVVVYPLSMALLVLAFLAASRSRHPYHLGILALALWLLWILDLTALLHLGAAIWILAIVLPHVPTGVDRIASRFDRSASPLIRDLLADAACVLLIVIVAGVLGWAWRSDLAWLAARWPWATPLLIATLRATVIVVMAIGAWRAVCRFLDDRYGRLEASEDAAARFTTLLPITRNLLLAVIAAVTALMVLKEFRVEIGPLLASAGVVGVALGFGAQTLVKDIISGVFYVFDDAFRIGEYIETAEHKGTVESFSLRSVKLRHQRGALATVPFGELGAVRNMSRDWVIDKFTINVPYDVDLTKVKKIIRDIGASLATDPEFAHAILEPLKLQGIEQFGSFAIELRIKMKTRPGRQFVIRRRSLSMIRTAFEQYGIPFAVPGVLVAGNTADGRS